MATSAQTLLNSATTAGYDKLSERDLKECILAAASGGGSGGGAPTYINYAGPPVTNPPALANIVVDTNGRQWQYFQSSWH